MSYELLSKTCYHNCYSPPWSKLVPVWAELVGCCVPLALCVPEWLQLSCVYAALVIYEPHEYLYSKGALSIIAVYVRFIVYIASYFQWYYSYCWA